MLNNIINNKANRLFIILAGFFITNALLAEIIGTKIFSLEKTLGIDPRQSALLWWKLFFQLNSRRVVVARRVHYDGYY